MKKIFLTIFVSILVILLININLTSAAAPSKFNPSVNAMAVWPSASNQLSYSIWTGTSWTPAAAVPTTNAPDSAYQKPSIAFDNNLNGMIVYRDTSYYPNYVTFDPSTWSWTWRGTITTASNRYCPLDIAFDGNNNAWVAIVHSGNGNPLYYARWDGSSWINTFSSTGSTGIRYRYHTPAVDFAPDNTGMMVGEYSSSYYEPVAARWDDSGWNNQGRVGTQDSAATYGQDFAYCPDGTGTVVWVTNNDKIYYRPWTGITWGSEGEVGTGVYESYSEPSVACSSDGQKMVIWQDGSQYMVYSTWNGAWSAPVRIYSADAGRHYSSAGLDLAYGFNNNAIAVWPHYNSNYAYYSFWDGSSWSTPTTVGGMYRNTMNSPKVVFLPADSKITLKTAGSPVVDKLVTVYDSGTATIRCQGKTNINGDLKCGLQLTGTYDVFIGTVGGTLIFRGKQPPQITTTDVGPESLHITLINELGATLPDKEITVYESGTTNVMCQGKTTATGILKCVLDPAKMYDIKTDYGVNMTNVAVPNTIIMQYYTESPPSTDSITVIVEDSVGKPLESTQVNIYKAEETVIVCQGNTNSLGQITCELDSTKSYDAQAIGVKITGIVPPDSVVITPAVISLLSLSGRVRYTNNSLIPTGSFNILINDSAGYTIWGPHTFNNSIVNGEFGLVLGGAHILRLIPKRIYTLGIAVCDLPNFEETAGKCVAGSEHYDVFTTYFKA